MTPGPTTCFFVLDQEKPLTMKIGFAIAPRTFTCDQGMRWKLSSGWDTRDTSLWFGTLCVTQKITISLSALGEDLLRDHSWLIASASLISTRFDITCSSSAS